MNGTGGEADGPPVPVACQAWRDVPINKCYQPCILRVVLEMHLNRCAEWAKQGIE